MLINFESLTSLGVDYDNKQQKKAIFRIEGENKYWAEAVDSEHKNYDYLYAGIRPSHCEHIERLIEMESLFHPRIAW